MDDIDSMINGSRYLSGLKQLVSKIDEKQAGEMVSSLYGRGKLLHGISSRVLDAVSHLVALGGLMAYSPRILRHTIKNPSFGRK